MCKPIFSAYHVERGGKRERREIHNVLHGFSVGYLKVNIKGGEKKERKKM
jgi:hypothetical protein